VNLGLGKPHEQAYALMRQGRPKEALALIEPWAQRPDATHSTLACYATLLKGLERLEESLNVSRLAAERFPASGVAWHNLASVLGDLGRDDEAIEAARKAFATGLDAPETWLVYARSLMGARDLEAARAAFEGALKRRPGYVDAQTDLAQTIWIATEDADAAAAVFDEDPRHAPHRARVYKGAGLPEKALAVVEAALKRLPESAILLQTAATLALDAGRDPEAVAYAAEALRRAPHDPVMLETWAGACLVDDRIDEALQACRRLVAMHPHNQSSLAMLAVAARLAGAPEYETLYDYDAFVRPGRILAPEGWPTLDAYLAELKAALVRLHVAKAHPLDQSLRNGTQTNQDLRVSDEPAIKAFFKAIDPLVRDYMAAIGTGAGHPLRERNTGDYAVAGAWSVRLRPNGFHVNHMHPKGWLSSAFYVETPDAALGSENHEGWIKFGQPNFRTKPMLEPARFVRPEPGRLVLFPSYMWHGTVPFTTQESRMTIAFDVVPA
jgi:tetratricopeptide (TPR) repeat protein